MNFIIKMEKGGAGCRERQHTETYGKSKKKK